MTDMDLADIDIVAAMDSLVPPQTKDDDDFVMLHDDVALHHHSEDPSATAPDVVSLTSKDYRLTGRPSSPLRHEPLRPTVARPIFDADRSRAASWWPVPPA